MTAQGTAALCLSLGCYPVRAEPAKGCADWERALGTDDEPGPPAATDATGGHVGTAAVKPVKWAP